MSIAFFHSPFSFAADLVNYHSCRVTYKNLFVYNLQKYFYFFSCFSCFL